MARFKHISSISPQEGKLIMNFASKGLQIPSEDFKIDASIPGYNENSVNPNLDDIIGATIDQYKLKDIADKLPDDLYDLDPTKSRIKVEKNTVNRFLWNNIIPKVQPDDKEGAWFNYTKALAVRKFLITGVMVIASQITRMFVNYNLKNLAITQLNKNYHNGAIVTYLDQQIQKVYDTNPDYVPVPMSEFVKTSIWQRNVAEWRDKTKNQKIRQLTRHTFNALITILCGKIPFPGNFLYTIPAKIILAYLGCCLATGSIYTLVVKHGKDSLLLRITLTKYGYELTDPELFVRRKSDGKLVRVILPDIPKKLYELTKEDLNRYEKDNVSLEQLKRRIEANNDS